MKLRRLGNSGLLVSELALGTMIFGEDSARGVAPATARELIAAYLDAGGNHFDVADVYAAGRAEDIVGAAVAPARDSVVLTTKVRWPIGSGANDAGLSRFHIVNSVEASLRRLRTDRIDVLYMHGWDPWTPLEESLRAFDDLVCAGKVLYIGVSNFKAWHAMKALGLSDRNGWARFVAAQYQYSLVVRSIEAEFADLCTTEGLGLVVWGPLGGGFLSGKYKPDHRPTKAAEGRLGVAPDAWEESWARRATEQNWKIQQAVDAIAKSRNSSAAQVSLAWLLAQPAVTSVIVGVRTPDQLADNLGVVALELTTADLDALQSVSAVPLDYPYRGIDIRTR